MAVSAARRFGSFLAAHRLALWDASIVYAVSAYAVLVQLLSTHRTPEDLYAEADDVAIVTGGYGGIGFQVSRHLALLGMDVIIAGPDDVEGSDAVFKIRAEKPSVKVNFLQLDLRSFDSIRNFAKAFEALEKPLHLLVNNAGVMLTPRDTAKVIDDQFAVNYFGHFLLTRLLLPHLASSGRRQRHSRVVSVSSMLYVCGDVQRVIDNSPRSSYSCYCDSKLATLMATYHLERLLRSSGLNVSATCVHPGIVASNIYRHLSWPMHLLMKLAPLVLWNTEQGASTTLYSAASSRTEGAGGLYFANCLPADTSRQSHRVDLQESLWISSSRLVGLGPKIQ